MNRGFMKTAAARLCGFLLVWAVILFTLAAAVYGIAGNGDLLSREMLRHAPPETTGLPETEYPGVGRMTAAYLTGQEDTFQYIWTDANDRGYVGFQKHEADHMADCRGLIGLAGTLRWITGAAALLLAGAGLLLRQRKAFAGGMLTGLCAAGALFAGIAVWALVNFDGLFVTFHRVAFTNDGWLLDPRTDLLIRLMPVNFFVSLGTRIMIWVLVAGIVLFCTGKSVHHAEIRSKHEKTDTAE
jgi:integral membrane protein (TIGR01906 family)